MKRPAVLKTHDGVACRWVDYYHNNSVATWKKGPSDKMTNMFGVGMFVGGVLMLAR